MQFDARFNPELGLALGMLHMHVRSGFLAREEVEPKPLDAQDRRTHSDRIAPMSAIATAWAQIRADREHQANPIPPVERDRAADAACSFKQPNDSRSLAAAHAAEFDTASLAEEKAAQPGADRPRTKRGGDGQTTIAPSKPVGPEGPALQNQSRSTAPLIRTVPNPRTANPRTPPSR